MHRLRGVSHLVLHRNNNPRFHALTASHETTPRILPPVSDKGPPLCAPCYRDRDELGRPPPPPAPRLGKPKPCKKSRPSNASKTGPTQGPAQKRPNQSSAPSNRSEPGAKDPAPSQSSRTGSSSAASLGTLSCKQTCGRLNTVGCLSPADPSRPRGSSIRPTGLRDSSTSGRGCRTTVGLLRRQAWRRIPSL